MCLNMVLTPQVLGDRTAVGVARKDRECYANVERNGHRVKRPSEKSTLR